MIDTETEEGRALWARLYERAKAEHLLDISSVSVSHAAKALGLTITPAQADKMRDNIVTASERHIKRIESLNAK